MYTQMYRKGVFNVYHSKTFTKNKEKKIKKTNLKCLTYGPPRKREYSWARDIRLMTKVVNAMESLTEDEEKGVKPKLEKAEEEDLKTTLHVTNIDYNIFTNTQEHRTDKYERTKMRAGEEGVLMPELVVRRGQQFIVILSLSEEYNKAAHDLEFVMRLGEDANPGKRSLYNVLMDETNFNSFKGDDWAIRLLEQNGKEIHVGITPPCNCLIGEWNMDIVTYSKVKEGVPCVLYEVPDDITVLLNPWCEDDATYCSTEKLLEEYVLNPYGCVFVGSYRQIGARPWFFGQFENGILEICLHLLRKTSGGEIKEWMSDPVKIAREISKIVNNMDEDGVLVGNWSGNYEGGKSPTHWVGSVKILQQFYRTNGTPVNYGQCWVFSGVVTTVCRALGLPCRSVTNFASAHDTDASVTIDTIFNRNSDDELVRNKFLSNDSVWNFHVWNEVWCSRWDLGPGYDGWQAIDATPQETSNGVFACGPAPLAAIKKGDISALYDTPFVFAEVNADRVSFECTENNEYILLYKDPYAVGKNISTKIPDGLPFKEDMSVSASKYREDLTLQYKNRDGSSEERHAMLNAKRSVSSEKNIIEKIEKDVQIELLDNDGIMAGEDFTITIKLKNACEETRTVAVMHIDMSTKTYRGTVIESVKHHLIKDVSIKPKTEKTLEVEVKGDEYAGKLLEQAAMAIKINALVKETNRMTVQTEDFRFRRPDLTLEAKGKGKLKKGEEFDLTISFKNSMPFSLTDGLLDIEGVTDDRDEFDNIVIEEIKGKTEWKKTFSVKVNRVGTHQISASFDCKILPDITGCLLVELEE